MKYEEYGKDNNDVIVLLHGGGLAPWSVAAAAQLLAENYRVIVPVLDGHRDADRPFTSIEDNAAEFIKFIDENFDGKVLLIAGLSLGGQILVEILSQREDVCSFALVESALVKPMKITHRLVKPMLDLSYWMIKYPWFARLQFKELKIRADLYEDYYRDSTLITKDNMVSFLKANSAYTIKPQLSHCKTKVHIVAGGKEQKSIIESTKLINTAIPHSTVEIIAGFYHGQLSINQPEMFSEKIKQLINN